MSVAAPAIVPIFFLFFFFSPHLPARQSLSFLVLPPPPERPSAKEKAAEKFGLLFFPYALFLGVPSPSFCSFQPGDFAPLLRLPSLF